LLGDPDIIILDEPTVGLDPRQITEIRELIRRLGEMKTVIVSSHILAEINEICNHVMIISNGQLVANDTLEGLKAFFNKETTLSISVKATPEATEKIMGTVGSVNEYTITSLPTDAETSFSLKFNNENDPREEIFFAFAKCDIAITEMHADHLGLEDIFLSLTDQSSVIGEHEDIGDNSEESKQYAPQFSANDSEIEEESEDTKA
jgi:ABC-2 type transport system ATP-binding protein